MLHAPPMTYPKYVCINIIVEYAYAFGSASKTNITFYFRILLGAYQLTKERERVGKNAGPMSTPHSYMTLEVGSTWVHTHPH